MAFDIRKFARSAEFRFELTSVGIVRCKSLPSSLMSQCMQRIKAPDFESKGLARWLLGELAKRPKTENFQESDEIEGDDLTPEQLMSVSDEELESFSERVVQKNRYLIKAREGEELQRVEGQSACEFLAHAIEHRGKDEKAQIERIIQSARGPLFVDSTLDSIRKSIDASAKYEDLIKQYSVATTLESIQKSLTASNALETLGEHLAGQASLAERVLSQEPAEHQILNLPLIHPPSNPIHETNQILENLNNQIEGMRPIVAQGAELIRTMNETALRMQADYIANAARSDRQTKNAMRVAVLSLIVSAIGLAASSWFSFQSYADSKAADQKSETQLKVFKDGIDALVREQGADRAAVLKSLSDANSRIPSAKNK